MERLVCRRAVLSNLETASTRQQSWFHTSTTSSRKTKTTSDTEETGVVRKFLAKHKNAATKEVAARVNKKAFWKDLVDKQRDTLFRERLRLIEPTVRPDVDKRLRTIEPSILPAVYERPVTDMRRTARTKTTEALHEKWNRGERPKVRKYFKESPSVFRTYSLENNPDFPARETQGEYEVRVRGDVYEREGLKEAKAPQIDEEMQGTQEPEVPLTPKEWQLTERRRHFKAAYEPSYVVTLSVTTLLHKTLSRLRTDHYPPSLNFEAGHITLFAELPASHLSHIALDMNQVVNSFASFPIRIRQTPHKTRKRLYLKVGPGEDKVKQIWKQLADKWRQTLPVAIPSAKEYEPSVIVLDHTTPEQRVEAFKTLIWQLRRLAHTASAYDTEGGTLAGVCTGLSLFERLESRRLDFKRRFVFVDVPTTGWNTPENLNIPATSGKTGSATFAEFPSRARES